MSQFEFEECAVATDGSEIWRNGVRYVAEPAVIPKPVPFANPSCQHRSINNDTWQCEACGETMIGCDATPQYVKSAPNAAAGLCANGPDCDGSEGCIALYIPDMTRAREVLIGTDITYKCQRCCNDGTAMSASAPIEWDCGHSHHGARIPAPRTTATEGTGS